VLCKWYCPSYGTHPFRIPEFTADADWDDKQVVRVVCNLDLLKTWIVGAEERDPKVWLERVGLVRVATTGLATSKPREHRSSRRGKILSQRLDISGGQGIVPTLSGDNLAWQNPSNLTQTTVSWRMLTWAFAKRHAGFTAESMWALAATWPT
jgi:hypothetical protein